MRLAITIATSMIIFGSGLVDFSEPAPITNAEAEYEFDAVAIPEADDSSEDVARNDETPDDHASGLRSAALGSGLAMFFSILFGSAFLEIMRVALLGAIITPLLSTLVTIRDDLLTRGRILGYLEANAGIHFSAIRDGLGLANGVTAYHLRVLESRGEVISWRDGKLRRYALSGLTSEEISRIRNPISGTRLAILQVLSESGMAGASGKEVQGRLRISRQLFSHHLRELRMSEMVEPAEQSRRPKWRVSNDGLDLLAASKKMSQSL